MNVYGGSRGSMMRARNAKPAGMAGFAKDRGRWNSPVRRSSVLAR